MWLPTTPYTQTLSYNQRVLINDEGRRTPIAWELSKVLDTIPLGITRLTFKQVQADGDTDCCKYGIANFCNGCDCINCTIAEPSYIDAGLQLPEEEKHTGRITYNGKDSTIRVGGSAKTLTAEYWDEEFVPYNAFWNIKLIDKGNLLCSIDAHYNDVWNITPSSDSFHLEVIDGDIRCFIEGKDILRIKLIASGNSIKISCGQLYSMVGKNLLISSTDKNGENGAEIIMEVIS